MDGLVNRIFGFLLPSSIILNTEKLLKNIALLLGLLSAVAIIFDWYPLMMFLSFPFCLIWIYCAWLHTEPQLKWINLIFLFIYSYGILRYFLERRGNKNAQYFVSTICHKDSVKVGFFILSVTSSPQ